MSIEHEKCVLGSCLLDPIAIDIVSEILEPEDFSQQTNASIFASMIAMSLDNKPIDAITLSEHMGVNNRSYLFELSDYVPTITTAKYYADQVKKASTIRRLSVIAQTIIDNAREGMDLSELQEYAETSILAVRTQEKNGPRHISSALSSAFDQMEAASKNKGEITGIPFGLTQLDSSTCGLNPGRLYILAARPAMGKTALALNITEQASVLIDNPVPSLIFSMEMPEEELAGRNLCSLGRVDGGKARIGLLEGPDYAKLAVAAEKLHQSKMYIDETPALSITEMRSRARRAKRKWDIGLVVVDYIQLARGTAQSKNREAEIGEITRGLKAMAKELKIPVLALSQLNRSLEKRDNKRPIMSDLRESGSIEQDADVIMFIYRDCVYNSDSDPEKAEIIIGKQRNGPIGKVDVRWIGRHTRFENDYRTGYEQ